MDNIVFGQYMPGHSFVHKRDPRLKISILLIMLVIIFVDAGFIGYGIIGGFVVLSLILSKMPLKRILKAFKPMMVMILFLVFFNLLLIKTGDLLVSIGPLDIYSGALMQSLYIVIRLLLIISFTTILTATTQPLDMTLGLEHLLSPLRVIKFPTHEIAMMISIALRFIPTLLEETQRIMKAQASRGVDFNEGTFMEKVRAIISLIIPLFISSFQRAEDLANAMESRNYNPEAPRTRYHILKWSIGDTMTLIVVVLICAAIIYIRLS